MSNREKNSPAPVRRAKKAEPEPYAPRRERRALSHVGGEVSIEGGSPEEGEALSYALDVQADEGEVMQDVHGFHSYPARMHPQTASRLIERLSRPDSRVLDPFCGSGTVVVEARALGRTALGSDLNPLGVELAWLKSRGFTRKFTENLVREAERIAQKAEDRRTEKAPPYVRYDEEDRERYPIHVLLELDSLTHGVLSLEHNEPQRALRLVLSSLLTKVSYSEGDTTRMKAPRRLAPGFAIRLFVEKMRELKDRLDEFAARVPARAPRAYVTHADARDLSYVENASIDLIVSSPPYPGVYDYLDHHLHRLKWLGLRESRLAESEIGARREYRHLGLGQAAELWRREIGMCLKEMRRILASDGRGVLIIADSVADRQAMRADEEIRKAADEYGVDVMAIASQERPLFLHGAERVFADGPRREHVVIVRPGKSKKTFSSSSEAQARAGADERPRAPRATEQRPSPRSDDRLRAPRADSPQGDRSRAPQENSRTGDRPWAPRAGGRADERPRAPRADSRTDERPRAPRADSRTDERPRAPRADRSAPPRANSGGGRAGHRGPKAEFAPRASGAHRGERPGPRESGSAEVSQRRTWGTRPKGPGKPRSRS